MNNSNYPLGSDNRGAPWNQKDNEPLDFDVLVTETLSKATTVTTADYIEGEVTESADHDENGWFNTYDQDRPDTSNTDWKKAYGNQHMSVSALINVARYYIERDIKDINDKLSYIMAGKERTALEVRLKHALFLLEECKGWQSDSVEYTER